MVLTQTYREKKNYKFTGKGKDTLLQNNSPHVLPFRFQVLLLCSLAPSTSIKKEINGPGASEWTHSQ